MNKEGISFPRDSVYVSSAFLIVILFLSVFVVASEETSSSVPSEEITLVNEPLILEDMSEQPIDEPISLEIVESSSEDVVYIPLENITDLESLPEVSVVEAEPTFRATADESDTESPVVSLISPSANRVFADQDQIPFVYRVSDTSNISDCTYSVSSSTQVLHSGTLSSNPIGEDITALSATLNAGTYGWNVSCRDISNNLGSENGSFSVTSTFPLMLVSAPSGTVTHGPVSFNYNYTSNEAHTCSFLLTNSLGTVRSANTLGYVWNDINFSDSNGIYTWQQNCTKTSTSSVYTLNGSFSVDIAAPRIGLSSSSSTLGANESFLVLLNVSSQRVPQYISYTLDYGNGSSISSGLSFGNELSTSFRPSYKSPGTYLIRVSATLGTALTLNANVSVSVSSTSDGSSPSITLLYPASGASFLTNDTVTFGYRAEDNAALTNCTFNLYNYTLSGSLKELHLLYTSSNKTQSAVIESNISLIDFDVGNYSWYVSCYDFAGNYNERGRDLKVTSTLVENTSVTLASSSSSSYTSLSSESYEYQEEVESLLSALTTFIEQSGAHSLEEKEALDDLGINEEVKFYKKKLLQIKLDLQYNVKYILDESSRSKRRAELVAELQTIKNSVPTSINVGKTSEYSKNGPDSDLEEILGVYSEAKHLDVSSRYLNTLVDHTQSIQSGISSAVDLKQVTVNYNSTNKQLTLVRSELSFKNTSNDDVLLVVIPKSILDDVNKVTFITKGVTLLGNSSSSFIYEVSIDDLNGNTLIYTINELADLSELEKVDILLVEEKPISFEGLGVISGFATLLPRGLTSSKALMFSWIALLVILGVFGVGGMRSRQLKSVKRDQGSKQIISHMRAIDSALSQNDLESAKLHYSQIQEVYLQLTTNSKNYFYKKIHALHQRILVNEARKLSDELASAVCSGNFNDATSIYGALQPIYSALPEKVQEKLYPKLSHSLSILRSQNGNTSF